MIKATNADPICAMRKAITVFFLYAAWQEQGGQHEALDVFLQTTRISGLSGFMWHCIKPSFVILLGRESSVSSKQAAVLASPHLPWWSFIGDKHLIHLWAAAASAIPHTDKIDESVVDTLLQIASNGSLRPYIPVGMWLWLNRYPFLPPICAGRHQGSASGVIQTVQALGDIKTLKSYLLLIWSEWDPLYSEKVHNYYGQHHSHQKSLHEMCTLIREDFSGVGMECHRGDLLQQLDHVLGKLDLGLEYLQKHKPGLGEDDIQKMKDQYRKLKKVLLGSN